MEKIKLTICFFGDAKKEDIFTLRWARYFSDRGYDAHLISYSPDDGNTAGNVKIHIIKKRFETNSNILDKIANRFFTVFSVRKILREIRPDIIHGHCVTSYGTLAAFSKFHPLVITAWGSDILINPKKSRFTKIITKYVLKKADLITCDAEHMKKAIIGLVARPEKVNIIYFGVDTNKFSPRKKENNKKIVISLRGLEPIYDVETLIKAVPIVLRQVPNAKFIIAGRGSEEQKLIKMASDFNISDSIEFIGWIDNDKLPEYLNAADIYVSTSLSDAGISSSTAEAMACGIPVVITDSGENKVWVKNKNEGFIVPVKNPETLAGKIIYLLENDDERKKMGLNARKLIEERNNYYVEMAKMENIYQQLKKI